MNRKLTTDGILALLHKVFLLANRISLQAAFYVNNLGTEGFIMFI